MTAVFLCSLGLSIMWGDAMYVQLLNGRIVGVCETLESGFSLQFELPNDFDFEHIDRYEITEDGTLVYHAPEESEEAATIETRMQNVESKTGELEEAIELLLSGVTE